MRDLFTSLRQHTIDKRRYESYVSQLKFSIDADSGIFHRIFQLSFHLARLPNESCNWVFELIKAQIFF